MDHGILDTKSSGDLTVSMPKRPLIIELYGRIERVARFHLLILAGFSAVLFLPMMGHGFVLDDFGHAFVAGQESVRFGLTHASGGPYYTPVAYSSFKTDWMLWGARPFPWAVTNLLLHIANTWLIYFLALRLWQSYTAAWWAGFGFALLFPANIPAIMWIATRAHLIAAFFYVSSMSATLWLVRTEHFKARAALAVITFAAFSMFSKETGVTVLAAIAVVILYERSRGRIIHSAQLAPLFAALVAVLGFYLFMRTRSGAIPVNFSGGPISYKLSLTVLWENFSTCMWRTYGLLLLVAIAVAASLRMRGARLSLGLLTKYDVLLSLLLFGVSIAPFALLTQRMGVYSYFPGISAALLLGAVANSLYTLPPPRGAQSRAALAPILLVVFAFVAFTIRDSSRYLQLAEINTTVLNQIVAQQPKVKPNTFVVLSYAERDTANLFPDGFSNWCFPWALRVMYRDRTVDGKIIHRGESYAIGKKTSEIHFSYAGGARPTVTRTNGS